MGHKALWGMFLVVCACSTDNAVSHQPDSIPSPLGEIEVLYENKTGGLTKVFFSEATKRTYAVLTKSRNVDTIAVGQYVGKSWSAPQVASVKELGCGNFLLVLEMNWYDMGFHWSDEVALLLNESSTNSKELLYVKELNKYFPDDSVALQKAIANHLIRLPADSAGARSAIDSHIVLQTIDQVGTKSHTWQLTAVKTRYGKPVSEKAKHFVIKCP